jgi:uncharacterized protein YkwD
MGGFFALAACTALAAGAPRYERFTKPAPPTKLERRALEVVQAWGRARGVTISPDPRLSFAARGASRASSLELGELRSAAQHAGWTDGELAAIRVAPAGGEALEPLLQRELDARLAGRDVNRVGVGAEKGAVVVLLSRRLVQLLPVPQRVRAGASVTFAGSAPLEAIDLTLVLAAPNGGSSRRLALPLSAGAFALPVALGSARGVLEAQLLLDRGRGPEVAASFPIGVDTSPWREEPAPAVGPSDTPESAVAAFLLGARASQGLAVPAESGLLAEVARSHAADMRDHAFFAHVSPTSGDLIDRLRSRHVRYVRALENLGTGTDVEQVLHEWLASASHRANLLDPQIASFGVGTAESAGKLFVVIVLVQPEG